MTPVWAIADRLDDLMHELGATATRPPPVLNAAQFDALELAVERMRGMLHQFAAGIYPTDRAARAAAMLRAIRELSTRPTRADPTLVRAEETPPMVEPEVAA